MVTLHFSFSFEVALGILTLLCMLWAPDFIWILSVDKVTSVTVQKRGLSSVVSAAMVLRHGYFRAQPTSVFHSHFNTTEFMWHYSSRNLFLSLCHSPILTLYTMTAPFLVQEIIIIKEHDHRFLFASSLHKCVEPHYISPHSPQRRIHWLSFSWNQCIPHPHCMAPFLYFSMAFAPDVLKSLLFIHVFLFYHSVSCLCILRSTKPGTLQVAAA